MILEGKNLGNQGKKDFIEVLAKKRKEIVKERVLIFFVENEEEIKRNGKELEFTKNFSKDLLEEVLKDIGVRSSFDFSVTKMNEERIILFWKKGENPPYVLRDTL